MSQILAKGLGFVGVDANEFAAVSTKDAKVNRHHSAANYTPPRIASRDSDRSHVIRFKHLFARRSFEVFLLSVLKIPLKR